MNRRRDARHTTRRIRGTPTSGLTFVQICWTVYRAPREGPAGIARRQQQRLEHLVASARAQSPYYQQLYRDLPESPCPTDQLPTVSKTDLMNHFDDWVTDRAVTKATVQEFLANADNVGHDFLGRYVVCTTSGATGVPAILLHDHFALMVYNVLGYLRSLPAALMTPRDIGALLRGRARLAAVFVTGGHFLGNTMMARRIRALPWRAKTQRLFSALSPVPQLVHDLNAFQPAVLGGYPSALETLAREQQAGRLHIRPILINAAGETLTATARRLIAAAFSSRVGNYYGSSEAVGLTYECREQRLHVNADWYLVEPVDEHNRAVPPGRLSDGVLVTNLANTIQPIIRYQMGDRVAIDPDRCPCGSPFPSIQVVGRTDDVLTFPTEAGEPVRILPLAVATVAEEIRGVAACQFVQRTPSTLTVRLATDDNADERQVWSALRERLAAFLTQHGATTVAIEQAAEPPALHPRSGKFRQVYSELTPQHDAGCT